ncbi:hypothetical protein A3842_11780 [Paenibacillus sp. P3E]|uniref:hypothetical protein n=1 Tax=Paenibacillus sp. P3E TaxID=1349435 RepID=UPI00093FA7C5|nr:hypothetical protein [Paenibacillus sp. P3E]OKP80573.1 hypothetical protein A3842_11780 [Paenibacillus sp. P3E]
MKKIYISLLAVVLLFLSIPISMKAADSQNKTISIPTEILTGSTNSQQTYYLALPSGVSSSSINTSSLKYNGTNEKVALSIENGKVKVTLKGVEAKQRIDNVLGYYSSWNKPFVTTPGNSIWRYSDGIRWQINQWDQYSNTQKHNDINGLGSGVPRDNPPDMTVETKSDVSRDGVKWYNKSVDQVIDPASIIESSVQITVLKESLPPQYVSHNIVNGSQFIIYYNTDAAAKNYDAENLPDSWKGGWATGRRYRTWLNYYFTASANVTSYKYSGNVSFDYNLPTEPTLTGDVTLIKPNPNPAKITDKVPVRISVKGELQAYSDVANIKEWVFYAKKKDQNGTLQTKKENAKSLTASKEFDFEINKADFSGEEFTQNYDLSVIVRFNKKVNTKAGEIDSLEVKLRTSAGVYKNTPTVTFPPVVNPPAPKGKPPIARISAPSEVKAGDDVLIFGNGSYDPDGFIKDYWWDTSGAQEKIGNAPNGTTWYSQSDVGKTFNILLTVVDNDSMFGSTSTEITVIKPEPYARLSVGGTLKQNRKVILTNSSTSPTRFPLVPEKTYVVLTALTGGSNADIKYSGTLGQFETKELLFKQPGTYKAAVYVENTLGYSSSTSITFTIVPDVVPVNYFSMAGVAYRSPENANKALVSIDDMSYSPDKDVIGRRVWEYRYDSNNDGNFNNETWVLYSDANQERLNMELSQVGKYEVRLTVFEEFGQPTIDEFVTAGDRKSTNSDGQVQSERIVEVKNRAPEVDWSW